MGEEGDYLKEPMPVIAQQATKEDGIILSYEQGALYARAGDWFLASEHDFQRVVANYIY